VLKQDATFLIRPGLADASCYSLESRNFPGHYLRHSTFRVRKDLNDGSDLFRQDATFCAQPGPFGTGTIALASYNIALTYVRHYAAEVWIASNGGVHPYDNPSSYREDISWAVMPAWAP